MPTTASAIDLPFKEAIDFFRQKVDEPSAHWTAVMDEAHSRAFAVAGATKDALITDFRGAVDKALAKGTSYQTFRQDFDAIVTKHGWSHTGTADWRAKIIYNTNLSTAYSAGRYAQATDPDVLAAFPYWQYQHINCPNPRLQHVAWSGMVLRADDPWWDAHYPPNGWGCHCQVFVVSARGLARMGKTPDQLKAPPVQWMEYVDRTTGRVTRYPAGVDPGFAYNPGKAWKDGAKQPLKAPDVRPVGKQPPVLAAIGAKAVAPEVIERFVAAPVGEVQIGTASHQLLHLVPSSSPKVLLSTQTMKKQAREHGDVPDGLYQALPKLLADPEAVLENRERHLRLFGEVDGQAVTAVVKSTEDGNAWYVVSFHLVSGKSIERFARRFKLLGGDVQRLIEIMK